jgi:hypothetical protein
MTVPFAGSGFHDDEISHPRAAGGASPRERVS